MSESAWLDVRAVSVVFFFFFNDTATTEIYTLSLHDALPILPRRRHHAARLAARPRRGRGGRGGRPGARAPAARRSEEHTSELQSRLHLVCRLLLEKKKHPPPPTPDASRLHSADLPTFVSSTP